MPKVYGNELFQWYELFRESDLVYKHLGKGSVVVVKGQGGILP